MTINADSIEEYLNTEDIVYISSLPTPEEKESAIFSRITTLPTVQVRINPGQTETPIKNSIPTYRNLSTDTINNCDLGEKIQIAISEQGGCFNTEDLPEIATIEELLNHLCEVLIRFDTDPNNYLKDDYTVLLKTICNSLIHLYLHENEIDYNKALNKPRINDIELVGNKTFQDLGLSSFDHNHNNLYNTKEEITDIVEQINLDKQDKLTPGQRINIDDNNVISADSEVDPMFKAWLQANAIYLAALLDEQPTNPENKYLNALRQWIEIAIGGAGYEAPIYYTNLNSTTHIIGSDTLFYKKISYQPEAGETPITVQSKDNVRTLVGTYLYDAQIATTTIDSGNFGFKLKCKVNNTQGTNVIEYVPFLYHIDGTRTDLFTCISDPITNTTFLDNFKQYPSDTIHCVETDRLGVDVYFKSSSNAFKTLDALIGDGHASYMVTPLRLRHDGLRDLDGNPNFLHITAAQKALITSTAGIVSGHTDDIADLQANKADKETTYTKSEVEQIKLELLDLIYAGL